MTNLEHKPATQVKTHVDEMPPVENVALPPEEHQFGRIMREKEKAGRKGWIGKALGSAAGIAVAAAGVVGYNMVSNDNEAPEPTTEPGASAPAVPGPVETSEPTAAPVETAEPSPSDLPTAETPETITTIEPVPADLPAQELVEAASALVQEWIFAGATEDSIEATRAERLDILGEGGVTAEEAVRIIAERNAEQYTDTILGSDWQNNAWAVEYREYLISSNVRAIQSALTRFVNGEPLQYQTTESSDFSELEAPDGQRIVSYQQTTTIHNGEHEPSTSIYVHTFDILDDGTVRLVNQETTQLN